MPDNFMFLILIIIFLSNYIKNKRHGQTSVQLIIRLRITSHHFKRDTSLEINCAWLDLESVSIGNHLGHTNHTALNLCADNLASSFTTLLPNQLIPFSVWNKAHFPVFTITLHKGSLELGSWVAKKHIGELTNILIIRSEVDCINRVIHFYLPFL